MWYLTEERNLDNSQTYPGPKYWLGGVTGGGRTIGRKHVDVRLKASSVSRTHAKLTVVKASFYTPSIRPHSTSLSVFDSSAYGTFLKYPQGHSSNRGDANAHHRRLDKNTPTDVCEGALLAFGAPASWWRVAWYPIACCTTRLSNDERIRLDKVSDLTSLEVLDSWTEDVTHLVANFSIPSSSKFLSAVAFDRHVVTPAWVEAVHHIVTDACKAITEAGTDLATIPKTNLPDEKLFLPPFATDHHAPISADILSTIFEPAKRARRKALFKGIALAFAREDRRSRMAAIVEHLEGIAVLASAIRGNLDGKQVVYVVEDGKQSEVDSERKWMPEAAVIEAILTADFSPLEGGCAAVAEVTDVATPGPLDAESDPESDDSEGTNPIKAQSRKPDTARVLGAKRSRIPIETPRKRSRPVEEPTKERKPAAIQETDDVPEVPIPDVENINLRNIDGVNPRLFMDTIAPLSYPQRPSTEGNDGDVRPFRRKTMIEAKIIALKRVRVERDTKSVAEIQEEEFGASLRTDTSRRRNLIRGRRMDAEEGEEE